jgi:hypothetical protein
MIFAVDAPLLSTLQITADDNLTRVGLCVVHAQDTPIQVNVLKWARS